MIGVLEAERLMILEARVKHYEREARLARETLRDQFAMAALQGLLSGDSYGFHDCAARAYEYADAMLEERRK